MSLSVDVRLAGRGVDLSLAVPRGRTLAVLGPNGAGKSTLLEIIAGLIRPDSGSVTLDGRILAGPGTWVPPHRRKVSLLSARPLLFPHLSVVDNVAFGPRSTGHSRVDSAHIAHSWLERLAAEDWAEVPVTRLSGGQAQRVALARALATDPDLLLLDEPFAALDVGVAATMRGVVSDVLTDRTAVIVTHELLDAALLADDVTVVEGGTVVETGPVDDVLRRPRSSFAAGLCDVNILRGTAATADSIAVAGYGSIRGIAEQPLVVGTDAVAVFPPAAVALHVGGVAGSPRNRFAGLVDVIEPHGPLVRVRVGDLAADVTTDAIQALGLRPGSAVRLAVKTAEVAVYPAS